jgi:hypothetical protein
VVSGADDVENASGFTLTHEIRMYAGGAEAFVVGRDDDVAATDQRVNLRQERDLVRCA